MTNKFELSPQIEERKDQHPVSLNYLNSGETEDMLQQLDPDHKRVMNSLIRSVFDSQVENEID